MSNYYHFAYGSNMNLNELSKYLPSKIKIIGTGYLDDHIFKYRTINNRKLSAKANIEPRKGSKVYGIIFQLYGTLKKLHKKEGIFNNTYTIKFHTVNLINPISNTRHKTFLCYSYVMTPKAIGQVGNPSKIYKKNIVKIAEIYNFPLRYIKTKLKN